MLALLLPGCLPWLSGGGARTVPPGEVRPSAGVSLLAAPAAAGEPLPQLQVGLRAGLRPDMDVGLSYAFPLTLQADVRRVLAGGRLPRALSGGGGVMAFAAPGVEGIATFPFLTGALHLGGACPGRGHCVYGALRGILPMRTDAGGSAVLWLAGTAGVEARWGRWTVAPEGGLVVRTLDPGQPLLLFGASLSRGRRHEALSQAGIGGEVHVDVGR